MLAHRKVARQWLKDCTRAEYDACTYAAKLTPAQKQITDMYILDKLPIREISLKLLICESLVRKRLAESYEKIAKL